MAKIKLLFTFLCLGGSLINTIAGGHDALQCQGTLGTVCQAECALDVVKLCCHAMVEKLEQLTPDSSPEQVPSNRSTPPSPLENKGDQSDCNTRDTQTPPPKRKNTGVVIPVLPNDDASFEDWLKCFDSYIRASNDAKLKISLLLDIDRNFLTTANPLFNDEAFTKYVTLKFPDIDVQSVHGKVNEILQQKVKDIFQNSPEVMSVIFPENQNHWVDEFGDFFYASITANNESIFTDNNWKPLIDAFNKHSGRKTDGNFLAYISVAHPYFVTHRKKVFDALGIPTPWIYNGEDYVDVGKLRNRNDELIADRVNNIFHVSRYGEALKKDSIVNRFVDKKDLVIFVDDQQTHIDEVKLPEGSLKIRWKGKDVELPKDISNESFMQDFETFLYQSVMDAVPEFVAYKQDNQVSVTCTHTTTMTWKGDPRKMKEFLAQRNDNDPMAVLLAQSNGLLPPPHIDNGTYSASST